jgi:hypothetical protein
VHKMFQASRSPFLLLSSLRRGYRPIHTVSSRYKYSLAGKRLGPDVATGIVSRCIYSGQNLSIIDDTLASSNPLDWINLQR